MNEEEQAQPPAESAAPISSGSVAAPEISRRVGSILDAVEREATRLREEARVEAAGYLDNARRRADGLVAERQRRISELSDELVAKSEAVIARLDDAAPVRQGFENLVRALGDAAERLAREADGGGVEFEPPPFGAQHAAAAYAGAPYAAHQQPAAPSYAAEPSYAAAPYQGGDVPEVAPSQPHRVPASQPYAAAPVEPRTPEPVHPARAPAAPGWRGLGGEPAPAPAAAPSAEFGWREQDEARMVAIQMAASGATRGGVREHLHRSLGLGDTGTVLDEVFGPGSGEAAQVPWTASRR